MCAISTFLDPRLRGDDFVFLERKSKTQLRCYQVDGSLGLDYCSQGNPEKKIASPFMLMQALSGTASDGQEYGLAGCDQGTGVGTLDGIIVDPYEYVEPEEMGAGEARLEFCDEWLEIRGQSISTVIEDPEFGSYFLAAIGDFYSLEGPFLLVQVELSLLDSGNITVDGQTAGVFLLDGNFEQVIAYASSGTINFGQVGTQLGSPVSLEFEGVFEKQDQPQPQGNAIASFEVVVEDAYLECDAFVPTEMGSGRFSVELEDAWYQGGPDASAYCYDYCREEGNDGGLRYPEEDEFLPACEAYLQITIGDLSGWTGEFLVIEALSMEYLEGGVRTQGYEAWVSVYDLYSYQTLGHGVQGSLSFNQIGGQDGDLVIGHFEVILEADCDEPQPPECMELATEVTTQIVAPMNAEFEAPVTVTVGYVDPIFLPDEPVEVQATAYVYSGYWLEGEEVPEPPATGEVYISLYIQDGQGEPLDYADAWIYIPGEAYLEGETLYFGLDNDDYLNPSAGYYASAMGMAAWGNLAGSIQIVDDGLAPGEQVDLRIRFDAASACFDEWDEQYPGKL